MQNVKSWLKKNWMVAAVVVLLLGFVYLLGSRSAPTQAPVAAVPTVQPTLAVPMCSAAPIKFSSTDTVDGVTTFKFMLDTGFNSGVDFGDGQHSNFKDNNTGKTLEVTFDHTYATAGTYVVGLFTFDYINNCDNGAAISVAIPATSQSK